jgi:hypothetical protein
MSRKRRIEASKKRYPGLSLRKLHAGVDVMFTKSKTALAVALFLGSTSLALAQGFDPNLANRYPHLANPQTYGYVPGANTPTRMDQASNAAFRSAPVQLRQRRHPANRTASEQLGTRSFQSRDVSLPRERAPSAAEELWMDRASQEGFGGGR